MVEIKRVTIEESLEIIEKRLPLGAFYTIEQLKGKKVYVGIDNTTGDAWAEDFKSLSMCKKWLAQGEEL